MPIINGRLTCCTCGADLGDASDPYRDPTCMTCESGWDDDDGDSAADFCPHGFGFDEECDDCDALGFNDDDDAEDA